MSVVNAHPDDTLTAEIRAKLTASFTSAAASTTPYPYWIANGMLPTSVAAGICELPFPAPELDGVSGRREVHNATRTYFDQACQREHPLAAAVATAFQSADITNLIETRFGASLSGTYLRAEFAQDTNGFWLEPHSDLGVKKFTLLLYLSDDPRHSELGTDIYDEQKVHIGTSPFAQGTGMIFVPSNITIHGFERRPFAGVRQSLIVNYVSDEWRARDQLAFPDCPIGT
jgi:hypothetical protein